jgi:predicted RNA-binding protein YlqC (UPF0109 family)
MKELVEHIARAIVNSPDAVEVTEETSEEGITLKLRVADEDKGRVIGKQGRIAQAMRTLIRVKAAREGTRASLEIITEEPEPAKAEVAEEPEPAEAEVTEKPKKTTKKSKTTKEKT